jgi:polysaccharide pyruvyl transferase WcaK-like protein
MNFNKSLFVNLTNSAIEAVKSHISEKSIESRIVFLINPASFQYFSIEKFGDLLISLKDKDYLIEIILTNITEGLQENIQIQLFSINKLLNLLDGITIKGKVFYQKRDIHFLDDYLLFAEYLRIQDMQFVLKEEFTKTLTQKDYFHLEQFIFKLIKENKIRNKQFYYRQQLKYLKKGKASKKSLNLKNYNVIDLNGNFNEIKQDSFDINWDFDIDTIINRGIKKLKGYFTTDQDYKFIKEPSSQKPLKPNPKDWKKVLITGWYGTETNGDKAIIGELVYFLRSCNPNIQFLVTTIQPEITKQTNTEIKELIDSKWINIEDAPNVDIISECDAIIMGGGPLMESSYMQEVCSIFQIANKLRKNRIIFGCGVGPIHTDSIGVLIGEVLRLSTAGFLRDQASFDLMKKLAPSARLSVACDPAIGFVRRWSKRHNEHKLESNSVALLVRANTSEFAPHVSKKELANKNRISAKVICSLFSDFAEKHKYKVALLQMNAPYVGGDDRVFNRLIGYSLPKSISVNYHREYLSLEELMSYLNNASISIAMRYHGHIFSIAMGIPFVSIDYTGKEGKVSSLVNRINYSKNSIIWDELNSLKVNTLVENIIKNKEAVSNKLLKQADKLVDLLKLTYENEFNINLQKTKY